VRKTNIETVLTVEMSMGQMVEDVEKVVAGAKPVKFFGRTGGVVPSPEEVKEQIKALIKAEYAPKTRKKKG
jgi:2-oxoglutarate ferredoxin oxidoreductase subunit alpha